MKLNLGCGRTRFPGFLNADRYGGEIACDAQALPFPDGTFQEVLMVHALEHVPDLGKAVREIHRVLRRGGLFTVIVPYGLRFLYDPYHLHAFSLLSMDRFLTEDSSLDAAPLFRLRTREISDFALPGKWHIQTYLPFLRITSHWMDNRVRFCLPLAPRNEITFRLEAT